MPANWPALFIKTNDCYVNVTLLEQLAVEGRGSAEFVRPDESVERLRREAKRRGVTLAELVAEIAAQLPDDALAEEALERFVGSGDSHDSEWATRDLHTLRSELAQRRPSEPA